jgi:hypothetical protein
MSQLDSVSAKQNEPSPAIQSLTTIDHPAGTGRDERDPPRCKFFRKKNWKLSGPQRPQRNARASDTLAAPSDIARRVYILSYIADDEAFHVHYGSQN